MNGEQARFFEHPEVDKVGSDLSYVFTIRSYTSDLVFSTDISISLPCYLVSDFQEFQYVFSMQ